MPQKAQGYHVLAGVCRMWEVQSLMPHEVGSVLDRIIEMKDASLNVEQVVPFKDLRRVLAVIDGWIVKVYVEVDAQGRWLRVREVHARGPG